MIGRRLLSVLMAALVVLSFLIFFYADLVEVATTKFALVLLSMLIAIAFAQRQGQGHKIAGLGVALFFLVGAAFAVDFALTCLVF